MNLPPHILTVDFETFWSSDFTLKKQTIEEYVRSPDFSVHGAAVKYGSEPSRWISKNELSAFFASVPWQDVALLCQNAPFDALILSHHYGVVPRTYLCTLAMARMMLPRQRHSLKILSEHFGLPAKGDEVNSTKGIRDLPPEVERVLAPYAQRDADNTYAVFRKFIDGGFPLDELEIVDTTIRMFAEPKLRLDKRRARNLLAKVLRDKRSALRRLGVTKSDVMSADKFSDILLDRFGIETEMKFGKPKPDGTPKEIPALAKTDGFLKSLLNHENPDVQALAAIRLSVKSTLEETRLRRLLSMHERGALAVYLNFAGAHTFRWSGGDGMNWQNFPRGSELRRTILAPKGYVLVVADLSQIEARVLNCLAEQWDVLKLFESGDPYSALASKFFGRPIDRKKNPDDKLAGQIGKVGELGLGYGMGPPKLQRTLKQGAMGAPSVVIDDATAKKWVYDDYRGSHDKVVKYWAQAETVLGLLEARVENQPWGPMLIHQGKIILPNGSALDYTGLRRVEGEWQMFDRAGNVMKNAFGQPIRLYGALLVENVVQALSRVIMSQAMPAIRALYRIVMSTHDELVCLASASEGAACQAHMERCMTKRPVWLPMIPLAAEGGFDACYSK